MVLPRRISSALLAALCMALSGCAAVPDDELSPLGRFAGTRQGLMKAVRSERAVPPSPGSPSPGPQIDAAATPAVFRLIEADGKALVAWSLAGMSGGGIFEFDAGSRTWRASGPRPASGASCRRLRADGPKLLVLCVDRSETWAYELELTAERDSLRAQLSERSTEDGTVRRLYDGWLVRSARTSFD